VIGRVPNLLAYSEPAADGEPLKPNVVAVKSGSKDQPIYYSFSTNEISKANVAIIISCSRKHYIEDEELARYLPLKENILDQ